MSGDGITLRSSEGHKYPFEMDLEWNKKKSKFVQKGSIRFLEKPEVAAEPEPETAAEPEPYRGKVTVTARTNGEGAQYLSEFLNYCGFFPDVSLEFSRNFYEPKEATLVDGGEPVLTRAEVDRHLDEVIRLITAAGRKL